MPSSRVHQSANRNAVRLLQGVQERSTIYTDNLNFKYYIHNETANIRQLRCINYYSLLCRGRGSMRLDTAGFQLTRPHTCNPQRHYDDYLTVSRQRARFPEVLRTYLQATRTMQASRTMLTARSLHQPSVPSTTREWGAMIISEEWRQRYENTIENQTRFYQGELVTEGLFYGIIFFNTEIVTTLRQHGINVSNVAVDGTFICLPDHPTDLSQLLTVHIIFNNMSFPVAYACLTRSTQAAYVCVMRYIFSLELPYSNDVPIHVITDFETGLRNAIRTVFPEWHQVGCSFHFNQAVLRRIHQIGLWNTIRTNVNCRNIVYLLLALPHLPANGNAYPNVRGFTISDGLMMIRAIAIHLQVFDELRPVFNYFDQYWMGVVGPERFSVHGSNHLANNIVKSFHTSLLLHLGVHPPLWEFYDLIRGMEYTTRLGLNQILNGQQVSGVVFFRNRDNITIHNALQDVINGGETMTFLREVASVNKTYIHGILFHDIEMDYPPIDAPVFRDVTVDIQEPPVTTHTGPPTPANDHIEVLCTICFNGEANVTLRPCGHKFCNICVLRLLEEYMENCPLCRTLSMEYEGIVIPY